MKVEITDVNLKSAYNEGCDDVKQVLTNLFPDFNFTTKLKVGDLVRVCDGSWSLSSEGKRVSGTEMLGNYKVIAFGIFPMSKSDQMMCRDDKQQDYNDAAIQYRPDTVVYIKKDYLIKV